MPSVSARVICPKSYLELTYERFGKLAAIGEPAVLQPRKCRVIK